MTDYIRDLDVAQGYNATADTHHPYGRVVAWTIGDYVVATDIAVTDPTGPVTGHAVAVLSHVGWSTLPNQNITLQGRVSPANAQQLAALAAQPLNRVVTSIAVVVYEYDAVAKAYYPSFTTYAGTPPNGTTPTRNPGGGFGAGATPAIYAIFGPTGGTGFGIKIAQTPSPDPVGIPNFALEVTLAPPTTTSPQQIRLQTSTTAKRIQPWGMPMV